MAITVRVRFEVFKRDEFTCGYCGRKSPHVVLEVDHIVPIAAGGTDDPINLKTSCWDCNRGKSDKPLSTFLTGEDPHDRAIALLEQERQLLEYNEVVALERARRENTAWDLVRYWNAELGFEDEKDLNRIRNSDWRWLFNALKWCPAEVVKNMMDAAIARGMDRNFKYVAGCCRNWRYERAADRDARRFDPDDSP